MGMKSYIKGSGGVQNDWNFISGILYLLSNLALESRSLRVVRVVPWGMRPREARDRERERERRRRRRRRRGRGGHRRREAERERERERL